MRAPPAGPPHSGTVTSPIILNGAAPHPALFPGTAVRERWGKSTSRAGKFRSERELVRSEVLSRAWAASWMRRYSQFSTAWNGGQYRLDSGHFPFQTVPHGKRVLCQPPGNGTRARQEPGQSCPRRRGRSILQWIANPLFLLMEKCMQPEYGWIGQFVGRSSCTVVMLCCTAAAAVMSPQSASVEFETRLAQLIAELGAEQYVLRERGSTRAAADRRGRLRCAAGSPARRRRGSGCSSTISAEKHPSSLDYARRSSRGQDGAARLR